jgi:hypothetical protein
LLPTSSSYNKRQGIIRDLKDASLTKATLVKITWRIQKNCQNDQATMLAANMANTAIPPMCSAMQMILQACRFNQLDDMPRRRTRLTNTPVDEQIGH